MALDREQVGLLFKLSADTTDARKDLTAFKTQLSGAMTDLRGRVDDTSRNILASSGNIGSSLAELSAGFSGWAATAGVAFAAVGAGILKLSLATAEYAGNIADLSAKTNLTTDTLQSLRLAATLSGQSFESVSQTAVFFQRRIEKARQGNEQLAETFRALGINLQGPVDEAFRNTLEKLSGFKDGAEKTALTVDLFGSSGSDLLPIMGQLGGQFSNLENRARELGIVLDQEAIKKADEFGEEIDILKLQLGAVANDIGSFFIPAFLNYVQVIGVVGQAFRDLATGAETSMARVQRAILAALTLVNPATAQFAGLIATGGGAGTPQTEWESYWEHKAGLAKDKPTKTGGGGGRTPREQAVRLPIEDFDRLTQQYFDRLNKLEEESLDRLEAARERSAAARERTLQEIEDAEIAAIQARVDAAEIAEEEGAARIAAVRVAAFARTEDALKAQLDQQTADADTARAEAEANRFNLTSGRLLQAKADALDAERQLTVDKLTLLEEERRRITEEGNRQIAEARDQDLENFIQHLENMERIEVEKQENRKKRLLLDPSSSLSIFGEAGQAAADKGVGLFGQLALSANEALGSVSNSMGNMQSMFADAFGTIGAGLGSMIEAFILTGELGPQAFRKLAAGVLASLAAQAAVKAVFELAEGLAAAARYDYVSAGQHFAAAKTFGLVALVAGIAGKVIAPGGSGAASGAGAGGRSQFGSTDKRIIEQGGPLRGSQQPQVIIIRAETEPGVVVRKVVEDYRSNGPSRQVLRRDMLGEG